MYLCLISPAQHALFVPPHQPHNILLAPRRSFSRQHKSSWQEVRDSLTSIDDLSLFTLKISDMGLGKLLSPGNTSSERRGDGSSGISHSGSVFGTLGWTAPEIMVSSQPKKRCDDAATSSSSKISVAEEDKKRYGGKLLDSWSEASSADIFSLGCVLYHVINPGAHLYGDEWFEREANIVNHKRIGLENLSGAPCAQDLVKNMTCKSSMERPTAKFVEEHLMFWPAAKKLNFLVDVSDKLELEMPASPLLLSIESNASQVVGQAWSEKIDSCLLDDLNKFRKYDVSSVRALLRVIRNKRHHWHELSSDVLELVQPFPDGLQFYFEKRFPNLVHHCYEVTLDIF
jgi:serine/threonine-protein kinase/endoribonuclease IRE1